MKYIRLFETQNRSELIQLKLRFNQVDLDYRVLFENTLNVADAYGLGARGVILEVSEKDLEVAEAILLDLDLVRLSEEENFNTFLNWYDDFSQRIGLLKDTDLSFRLVILIVFVAVFIMGIVFPLLLLLSSME
ncbi:MAG: hypothetical protein P8P48_14175 [Saprospiraceae bacterium]|jgi:hypothetical protein|nr:hypothetical protein [Saprospiraceae bacterium]